MKLWNDLYRKVRFAVLVAIPLNSIFVLAWVNGSTSWRVALASSLSIDAPLVVAWCVRETHLTGTPTP